MISLNLTREGHQNAVAWLRAHHAGDVASRDQLLKLCDQGPVTDVLTVMLFGALASSQEGIGFWLDWFSQNGDQLVGDHR